MNCSLSSILVFKASDSLESLSLSSVNSLFCLCKCDTSVLVFSKLVYRVLIFSFKSLICSSLSCLSFLEAFFSLSRSSLYVVLASVRFIQDHAQLVFSIKRFFVPGSFLLSQSTTQCNFDVGIRVHTFLKGDLHYFVFILSIVTQIQISLTESQFSLIFRYCQLRLKKQLISLRLLFCL